MVDCGICKEPIRMLEKKHEMENSKGRIVYYCNSCYSNWKKEDDKKIEKEYNDQMVKILTVNSKWEYMVKKIETTFGGRVKTEDDELHKLGRDGWELVSIAAVNQANMFTGQVVTLIMAFKRRIP